MIHTGQRITLNLRLARSVSSAMQRSPGNSRLMAAGASLIGSYLDEVAQLLTPMSSHETLSTREESQL